MFIQFVKKHKALSFVIGAIILFFVAFGATMGIVELVNPNDVQIPDLVNKTQDEAEQIVKDLKLKLVVKSEEYNQNVEEGKIISQAPAYQENYTIKEHSEISVVISKGTETVEVPDVVGKTREEAEKLLQLTYRNPLIVTVKCPSVKGGMLENAKFRVSKRTSEMHKTGNDEDTSKSKWKVSFNLMQKELTAQQKQTVSNA